MKTLTKVLGEWYQGLTSIIVAVLRANEKANTLTCSNLWRSYRYRHVSQHPTIDLVA